MKRFYIILATVSVFLFFFVSCYYDNEEALYPALSNSCDTTNVTFSGTIVPILKNNCYSCHSNANAAFGANIHLEGYANVVTNYAKIIVSINLGSGVKAMPPGGKLKACSLTQFDIWIRNGMLNN
ncbi:MAG TPA: hypothetical protein VIK07_09795 [Bacteroidales bacterium]